MFNWNENKVTDLQYLFSTTVEIYIIPTSSTPIKQLDSLEAVTESNLNNIVFVLAEWLFPTTINLSASGMEVQRHKTNAVENRQRMGLVQVR